MIAHARMLDYEMEQVHTLTIEATDQATPVPPVTGGTYVCNIQYSTLQTLLVYCWNTLDNGIA